MAEGNPKAKGWLSSIISIIIAILLLHTFPVMGNWIDKQRTGEGKYDFDEDMCFDVTKKTDFYGAWTGFSPGAGPVPSGTGGFVYEYTTSTPPPPNNHIFNHAPVDIMTVPLNKTINGYGVSMCKVTTGNVITTSDKVMFCMNFTKKKILDLDITRIDIYLDIGGASFTSMQLDIRGFSGTDYTVVTLDNMKTISLGNITKISITVGNLLKLNTMGDTDKIMFIFNVPTGGTIPDNTFIIFDMQWYCIEEIKTPTLTRLAGWIALMNTGILIMIFISFPQVQILGRFDSIAKKLEAI